MAELLKGAEVVAALNERLARQVEALRARKVTPNLAIVRVGSRPDDVSYERGAVKRGAAVGVNVQALCFPESLSQAELLAVIRDLNTDPAVHGILLFRPLPAHLEENAVRNLISPAKDVDGLTDCSLAGVFAGSGAGFPPCTPAACLAVLGHYGLEVAGKDVVVLGSSLVVGRPVAMLLLHKKATVTLCHSKTRDLAAKCQRADILVAAVGRAGLVDESFLSPGQVVLDVGINLDPAGKISGDVNFAQAERIVKAMTPVPGGLGMVTTAVLAKHVIEAAGRIG